MELSRMKRYRLRKTSVDVNLALKFVWYVHCAGRYKVILS